MPVTAARRYQDPNDEAKLLLGFIAVAAIAGVGYICYSRLHVRKEQLMEASLYILACVFRLLGRAALHPHRSSREGRTPGRIRRCASAASRTTRHIRKAFADDSIVIGYDIHQKPVLWPDEVRVMQANGFGMTGRRQDHPAAEHHPARPGPRDRA